jgi:hypothetical protein
VSCCNDDHVAVFGLVETVELEQCEEGEQGGGEVSRLEGVADCLVGFLDEEELVLVLAGPVVPEVDAAVQLDDVC